MEFYAFCRLFRLRHHVVDGGLDLGVAQRRFPPLAGIARALPGTPLTALASRVSFRRKDVDMADGFNQLGHTRTDSRQRAAMLADPVRNAVVMGHKNEYEQHQHHTDP